MSQGIPKHPNLDVHRSPVAKKPAFGENPGKPSGNHPRKPPGKSACPNMQFYAVL